MTPSAVEQLIDLLVHDLLARPLGQIVDPKHVAERWVAMVRAISESDAAVARLVAPIVSTAKSLHEDHRRLRELLPAAASAAADDLVAHPFTPDKKIVSRLLASDPVKDVLRELVQESFKSQFAGVAGIGKMAAEKTGALGALAGSLVGKAKDKLASGSGDMLDSALDSIVARLVEVISDPRRGKDQIAVKRAFLESALSLRVRDLAKEVEHAKPEQIARIIRRHAHAWSLEEHAVRDTLTLVDLALGPDQQKSFGECLHAWGIEAAGKQVLRASLHGLLAPFLSSPAFATWLEEVRS